MIEKYSVKSGTYIDDFGETIKIDGKIAIKNGITYDILFQTPHGNSGPKIRMAQRDSKIIVSRDLGERVED